ncbi:DNA replication/repair protein RecF [Oceanibaculum pacificum]|uniref:DNA replication and repair protein RecF n=1 Tax=Oceanibaculum pacificum TaxID=580166 RepID=A0A154WH79_9PROT|nr:DNA replication/repair protein RecF [Oceanibaculum pacificum]KZD12888.1 recombinase RecF [Oceanibaculum pacificum]
MNAAFAIQPRPTGSTARLAVRRLTVTDFRCYAGARLEIDQRPVVLTGANGAGKTNLLEAISFLSPGRGLRRAKLSEIDRLSGDAGGWVVAAKVETRQGPVDIGTGRDISAAPGVERRVVRIDGAPARSQNVLADHLSLAWLTPQMDRLFLDGASGRRRFFDRLAYGADPAHATRVNSYEHALRERARLLKQGRADNAWLTALEEQMAAGGIAIAAARQALVARLNQACEVAVGPFPRAALALEGAVDRWLEEMPALAAEDRLRAALAASRRQDSESGGASEGPHRSDIVARHVDKDMPAALCSTGEQKALLIAITLAHARLQAAESGSAPILLLDEVAAHLDEIRRAALYDEICALGAQAWLTGTDRSLFEPFAGRAQYATVADAAVVLDSSV